ncbi:1-aminocyclopropane-1-carboxylate oxidase homolog [Vitis riparia]|uniref:1-aminocyclopropane-1-carboxylate oxidase homolog n=1 Tax=Vitis riparia TaxID=96939 RepID=UPI00155AD1EF|nr:1-aminocyclopropane-1-carboxylate oxidase homolog [Vitis riparia]
MMLTSSTNSKAGIQSEYDRESELKAFDGSKTGVKGLVDAGVTKIPRIFINQSLICKRNLVQPTRSRSWVVNHGIPTSVLEEMTDGIRGCHEQDAEAQAATWEGNLACSMAPNPPDHEELPARYSGPILEGSEEIGQGCAEESLTVKKVSGLKREDSEGFFPENPGDQEVFKLNVMVG